MTLVVILIAGLVLLYFVLPDRFFVPGRARARFMHEQFVRQNGGASGDAEAEAMVGRIGARLAVPARERLKDVEFSVVRSAVPNACAIGAHHVCVTEGLIELLGRREGALAPVIAHELGHIVSGHAARRWKNGIFLSVVLFVLSLVVRGPWLGGALGIGKSLALSKFSRVQEFEADGCSLWLCRWAGYDPREAAAALEKVGRWHRGNQAKDPISRYFASHPPTEVRIKEIHRLADEMDRGAA